MRRREFIKIVAGSAAGGPLAARAQHVDQVRRIGWLTTANEDNVETKPRLAAFVGALQQFGWIEGRNVRMTCGQVVATLQRLVDLRQNWLHSGLM